VLLKQKIIVLSLIGVDGKGRGGGNDKIIGKGRTKRVQDN